MDLIPYSTALAVDTVDADDGISLSFAFVDEDASVSAGARRTLLPIDEGSLDAEDS